MEDRRVQFFDLSVTANLRKLRKDWGLVRRAWSLAFWKVRSESLAFKEKIF